MEPPLLASALSLLFLTAPNQRSVVDETHVLQVFVTMFVPTCLTAATLQQIEMVTATVINHVQQL